MQVERISADITLKHKPKTGTQAYNMLIASLKAEIWIVNTFSDKFF